MPKSESRKLILGFDESNNGWGIKSQNPHHETSMIFTGYLGDSNKSGQDYKRKARGMFGKNGGIEQAIKKGKQYISNNPDFFLHSPSPLLKQKRTSRSPKSKIPGCINLKISINLRT